MRLPGGGYVRSERTNEVTGTTVQVLDLCHPDTEFAPEYLVERRDINGNPVAQRTLRWASHCIDHATLCAHERLEDAKESATDPTDWCPPCADMPTDQEDR